MEKTELKDLYLLLIKYNKIYNDKKAIELLECIDFNIENYDNNNI